MRRTVITGLGTVNPLANNIPSFWQASKLGQSGIGPISQFDTNGFRTHIAGEVKRFEPETILGAKTAKRMDRYAQFGVVAAIEAVQDSNLDLATVDGSRVAVIVGTGIGGMSVFEDESKKLQQVGPSRISPFLIPRIMPNAAAAAISIHYGLTGPCLSVSSACASAADAISVARDQIRTGRCEIAITGGAEAPITPLGMAGFCAARSLSERNDSPEKASRPFDRHRDGFVLGEGAAVLVLEDFEHARRRGAKIYCEIVGCGQSADAHHMTAPDPEGKGAAQAMRLAMQDARIAPSDVQYLNAHATGTELGDAAEALAIRKAFGMESRELSISCTKSLMGHLCGASGGIAAAVIAKSIQDGVIHPTLNCDEPSEEWIRTAIRPTEIERKIQFGMLNSFGFGGHNSSLVFKAL